MVTKKKSKKKLKKTVKNHNHNTVIEISKGKPRQEEEKFFIEFSERHINAVLLVILASTFLVQGVTRYLESIGRTAYLSEWFSLAISSIAVLTFSVVFIVVSGVLSMLKFKRLMNILGFISFLIGFLLFLASLIFILVIV